MEFGGVTFFGHAFVGYGMREREAEELGFVGGWGGGITTLYLNLPQSMTGLRAQKGIEGCYEGAFEIPVCWKF